MGSAGREGNMGEHACRRGRYLVHHLLAAPDRRDVGPELGLLGLGLVGRLWCFRQDLLEFSDLRGHRRYLLSCQVLHHVIPHPLAAHGGSDREQVIRHLGGSGRLPLVVGAGQLSGESPKKGGKRPQTLR